MLWHHDTRVNSHQRWKQTRFRVCFHLWCELTSTMDVTEWQVSWNSWFYFQVDIRHDELANITQVWQAPVDVLGGENSLAVIIGQVGHCDVISGLLEGWPGPTINKETWQLPAEPLSNFARGDSLGSRDSRASSTENMVYSAPGLYTRLTAPGTDQLNFLHQTPLSWLQASTGLPAFMSYNVIWFNLPKTLKTPSASHFDKVPSPSCTRY